MIERQLEHDEVKNNKHNLKLYVICDSICSPENTGMIFRISDAFGVNKIFFSENTPSTKNQRLKKASRNTCEFIGYQYDKNLNKIIIDLKNDGFKIYGLEITNKSIPIQELKFETHKKIAVVIGSEKIGISNNLLKLIDTCIHIPMYGKNSSMNVVNALAITLYEISKQSEKS